MAESEEELKSVALVWETISRSNVKEGLDGWNILI